MIDIERPLRVLIFDRGLVNPYSLGLARGLEQVGTSVALAGPAQYSARGVTAIYPRAGVPGQRLPKAREAVTGVARLVTLVTQFKPDVLHFQWASLHDYAIARVLRPSTRARIVFTVHNPVPVLRDPGFRWQRAMIEHAQALIVHGPQLRAELLRNYEVPTAHVHVVPHGNFEHAVVRHDRDDARRRLGLPLEQPVFSFIGQLASRKGLDTLMEAFRLHCEQARPGVLVLAGPSYGVDERELRRRIDPYGERVRWLSSSAALPAEQLDLVVSAATQVVLPFDRASQSGSVLYSMTHGRCVVTTRVGELAETVGERGLLVPPRDPIALADALRVADDPVRCDRLGRAARAYVIAALDWRRLARLTIGAYLTPAEPDTTCYRRADDKSGARVA